jgi:hypothetical protein
VVIYRNSVIRGGAYSAKALAHAIATDRVVAAHYAGFDAAEARPVPAPAGRRMYASYRIANAVYWTAKPIPLHEDETLLTDGVHLARARCGNRLSETPQAPVGPVVEFDEESLAQVRDQEPADTVPGAVPVPFRPPSRLAFEVFPAPLAAGGGSAPAGTPAGEPGRSPDSAMPPAPGSGGFGWGIPGGGFEQTGWGIVVGPNPVAPPPPPPVPDEYYIGPGLSGFLRVWYVELSLWTPPAWIAGSAVGEQTLSSGASAPPVPGGLPPSTPGFGQPPSGAWKPFDIYSGQTTTTSGGSIPGGGGTIPGGGGTIPGGGGSIPGGGGSVPGGGTNGGGGGTNGGDGGGGTNGGGSGGGPTDDTGDLTEIPEPAAIGLVAIGLALLALRRARYTAP